MNASHSSFSHTALLTAPPWCPSLSQGNRADLQHGLPNSLGRAGDTAHEDAPGALRALVRAGNKEGALQQQRAKWLLILRLEDIIMQ